MVSCQSLKESVLLYLSEVTSVTELRDGCIITLPVPTLDARLVDVFVEATGSDYMLVHDGGKAVNELILQGVDLTSSITQYMESVAKRFHLLYQDQRFVAMARRDKLVDSTLAVGMCSALAMAQLVGNVASLREEEPIRQQFGKALKTWARHRAKIDNNVVVNGRRGQHRFDFLATPRRGRKAPIALSVLDPGSNPLGTAERFGYIASDLDQTEYSKWSRVAVQSRAEEWTTEAKKTVQNCADVVIEIPSEQPPSVLLIENKLQLLVVA